MATCWHSEDPDTCPHCCAAIDGHVYRPDPWAELEHLTTAIAGAMRRFGVIDGLVSGYLDRARTALAHRDLDRWPTRPSVVVPAPPPSGASAAGGEVDLTAIERRIDRATPEPWVVDEFGHVSSEACFCYDVDTHGHGGECGTGLHVAELGPAMRNDAEFIAHARQDVPALLKEVRRLRALAPASAAPGPIPPPAGDGREGE